MSEISEYFTGDWVLYLSIASAVFFVLGLISIPYIVCALPEDALSCSSNTEQRVSWLDRVPGSLRPVLFVFKNVLAVALLILGVAMLVLPGQGLLTIFIGLVLLDFPGKSKIYVLILQKPWVLEKLNKMRIRRGGRPFRK